jgi:peptidyl-prolyl cis-trans isomerase C
MQRTYTRFSRSLSAILPVLFLGLLAWSGCGQGSQSDAESEGPPYQVGNALTDSTVALIVESDYGVDTIDAQGYRQRLNMMMQQTPPNQRSGQQMQDMHEEVVRRFVGSHVLEGRARESDISVDSAEISSQLQQIKGRYEDSTQFREELAKNNITVDSLRNYIASRLRQRDLQQQMANTAEDPSSSEIEDYAYENRSISAQHILLRVGEDAPDAEADSVRQVATALVDSAKMSDVDFGELARRHSEGPSASKGGNLGSFTRDRMVEPFAEAAYSLSDSGDVYDEPVRTKFGFHVIRLTDAGTPMDTSRARQKMMQERKQEAFNTELESMMKEVTVRANPSIVTAGLYEEESASNTEG